MVWDEEIASFFHLMIDGIYNKLQIASFNPTLSGTMGEKLLPTRVFSLVEIFHFVEIQLTYFPYLQICLGFWYPDEMFSASISTALCLKSETLAHAKLAITRLKILVANFLTWYQFGAYIGDKCGPYMTSWIWSHEFSWKTFWCATFY